MTAGSPFPYDPAVGRDKSRWKKYVQPSEIEKANRGGAVDVRNVTEHAGTGRAEFYVVLRFGRDYEFFSIADLMNRPPRCGP